MKSARLGLLALSACSLFLLGCPTAIDMHKSVDASSSGSGGRTGSGGSPGTGGASNPGTGGTPGTGGSPAAGTGGRGGAGAPNTGGRGGAAGGAGGMKADAAGGGMEMAPAAGNKVPANVQAVFTKACNRCHMNPSYGDATQTYTRLKGMTGNTCMGGKPRMTPGMGAMSIVILKMKGMVPMCGAKMPPNGAAPTEEEIKTVEDWITAGAIPVP